MTNCSSLHTAAYPGSRWRGGAWNYTFSLAAALIALNGVLIVCALLLLEN